MANNGSDPPAFWGWFGGGSVNNASDPQLASHSSKNSWQSGQDVVVDVPDSNHKASPPPYEAYAPPSVTDTNGEGGPSYASHRTPSDPPAPRDWTADTNVWTTDQTMTAGPITDTPATRVSEPEVDRAPYVVVDNASSHPSADQSSGRATSLYPNVDGNTQRGSVSGQPRAAPDASAPPAPEGASEDPLLEPLLSETNTDVRRWKSYLGWGSHLAGESMMNEERLVSLDVFRGLAISMMILASDASSVFPIFGASTWSGIGFGDLPDPFFLFVVGVSVAIAFKRVPSKKQAFYKIIVRAAKIFILGLLLEGGYYHGPTSQSFGVDLSVLRFSGFLQRVAVCFFIVALCEVAVMKRYRDSPPEGFQELTVRFLLHWGVALTLAAAYVGLTYFLAVPDWSFTPLDSSQNGGRISFVKAIAGSSDSVTVSCGGSKGSLEPDCNAAGFIDRLVLGLAHMRRTPPYAALPVCTATSGSPPPAWCEAPFEINGLLSTIGASLTVFAGLHFGHVLTHFRSHWVRMIHTAVFSAIMLVAGWALQFPLEAELDKLFPGFPSWLVLNFNGIPFNRPLYSISFMLFSTGLAGLLLCVIYIVTDAGKVRFYTVFLEWIGKNPLLVYVLAVQGTLEALVSGLYWKTPDANLASFVHSLLADYISIGEYSTLVTTAIKIVGWAALAGFLFFNGHTWKF
eukprot:TRINITY_DN33237_c0_g1_i1.p1 TRINITY_DN33237_c0_g1~~TRINITY_DN33237_c0_g1_i1.p1  ORF type:complete len:684 (+),score=105.80 TRINITY_DN33237_c0_g1_i1:127-2178(+)